MKGKLQRDEGVAAIEFGLLLPVLVIVIMGILDYGWMYMLKLTLTNAAREGARVGVTLPADAAEEAARAASTRFLASAGIDGATVSITGPSDDDPEVEVTIALDPYVPLVGLVPTPEAITATSTMRWELAPTP